MKILVIYYSFEGNTRMLAERIAQETSADIEEIRLLDKFKSRGFSKYIWGGKQVFITKTPEIEENKLKPQNYDFIFIGSPVWAGTYAPAIRSFIQKYPFSGKKIAAFCCHGGGKGRIFRNLKKALGNNQFVSQIDFKEPLKKNPGKAADAIAKWAAAIVAR